MVVAVSTTATVLALIGLLVGVIVLLVVIALLQGVLSPLRAVLADVKNAQTAPMLERGIQGVDQLGQTRRLAESVPNLAMAYLQKLSRGGMPAAPTPAPAPAAYAAPPQAPAATAPPPLTPADEPAWKKFMS